MTAAALVNALCPDMASDMPQDRIPPIITEYQYDGAHSGKWCAFYEGWDEGPLGFGATKAEAIADLEDMG